MWKVNAASIPRSERILRRANAVGSVSVGSVVRVVGNTGGRPDVEEVDPEVLGGLPAHGFVVKLLGGTDCIVQFAGPMKGIYSGLIPGRSYFVVPGAMIGDTPPTPSSGGLVYVQRVGYALSDNELLVMFGTPIRRIG